MTRFGNLLAAGSLALAVVACSVPPEPARLELRGPLTAGSVDMLLGALRDQGYKIQKVDRDPVLVVEGAWSPHQRQTVPGWKRVRLREGARKQLLLTVEVRYLNLDLWGRPYETTVTVDRELEDDLLSTLGDVLF